MPSIETPEGGVLDSEIPAAFAGDGTTMASFGEELRRQRELRSVSLREISDSTKINIRFLEALEANDFKHLPGGQFNKGFIRAYARHIGVDGEDMVNAYTLEVRRQEEEAPTSRASTPRARLDPADRRALIALGVLAAIVVLIGLGVWYLFFHKRRVGAATPETSRAAHGRRNPAPREGGTASGAASPATSQAAPESAGPPGAEGSKSAPVPSDAPTSAEPPPATAPAPAPRSDNTDARATAAASTGVEMTLRAVPLQSVKFGLLCDGKEAFSGTLEPGRSLSFTCAGVYDITVEDAGAVNLSIDGERIYVGRRGQSIAGRHVSRANLPDFLNPPYEPPGR